MPHLLTVPDDLAPVRLDRFVADHLPGASRRRVRGAEILVNGRPSKHGALVRPGDVISVPDSLAESGELAPNQKLSIPFLYEDKFLLAVDKPAGISSVALRSHELETVANFLLAVHPDVRHAGKPLEAGLVHRLDRDTSGVLVAARSRVAYESLRQQFSTTSIEKTYIALVTGVVAQAGRVDTPIAQDHRRPDHMLVVPPNSTRPAKLQRARTAARPASTFYRPLEVYRDCTLIQVTMHTGVRHQIRAHLASVGHPIVGDRAYGGAPSQALDRQALHASRIELKHPADGKTLVIESPLPRDFAAAIARLRK